MPKGDLAWNKKYTADMSVAYNQDYNELPQFTLSTSGYTMPSTSNPSSTQTTPSTDNSQQTPVPTLTPTPQPIPSSQSIAGQQVAPKKKCFLFFCF